MEFGASILPGHVTLAAGPGTPISTLVSNPFYVTSNEEKHLEQHQK